MAKTHAQRVITLLLTALVLALICSCNFSRAERHYRRGMRALEKGRTAKAREEFSKAIYYNPQYAQAFLQLASVYESEGMLEQARGVYQELLRIDPLSLEAECKLAGIHSRLGQWQDAIACFNSVISKNPASAEAYYGLATIYRRQRNNKQAAQAYEKAIACNAMLFEARYSLALLYYIDGRFEDARKHAAIAVQRYPSAGKLLSLIDEELPPSGQVAVSYHH